MMTRNEELNAVLVDMEKSFPENQGLAQKIQEEVKNIAERIVSLSDKIQESKDKAVEAQGMGSGWFRTGKKTDAVANALVKNAEADAEMHNLVQEVIKFSCMSSYASAMMIQGLSKVVESGFEDSYGYVQEMDETAKEIAENLIQNIEKSHVAQNKHDELKKHSDFRDEEHDRQIAELYKSRQWHMVLSVISLLLSIAALTLVFVK